VKIEELVCYFILTTEACHSRFPTDAHQQVKEAIQQREAESQQNVLLETRVFVTDRRESTVVDQNCRISSQIGP